MTSSSRRCAKMARRLTSRCVYTKSHPDIAKAAALQIATAIAEVDAVDKFAAVQCANDEANVHWVDDSKVSLLKAYSNAALEAYKAAATLAAMLAAREGALVDS